jgi:hypothetical protein
VANEVAERDKNVPADFAGAGPTTLAVMGFADPPELDPESVAARIAKQLLSAESAEDLTKTGQTWSFADLLGVPVEARSVVVQRSTLEGDGPGTYMLIEATNLTSGEDIVITCGAMNVMQRLAIANDRGWLPFRFKVKKSDEPTQRGFNPYIMESV